MIIRFLVLYDLFRSKRQFGLWTIVGLLLFSLLGNAICFMIFDAKNYPDLTLADALWYSVISMTTIGYGDFYAQSAGARIGTLFFIVLTGLASFTMFLGFIVEWAAEFTIMGQKGMSKVIAQDHILLIHFPSSARIRALISELRTDPQHAHRRIIVVSDQIESLPFDIDNVRFVHGSPLVKETFDRARIEDAEMAIVLGTSYSDSNSDAVVSTVVSVLNRLNSSIHVVAECLEEGHRILFEAVACDAVVPTQRISGNLLVQEAYDPGITQMIDVITSNTGDSTLFSTKVERTLPVESYGELAKRLLDGEVNLLSISRGSESLTNFSRVTPQEGDRLIYVSQERVDWSRLSELAHA